MSTLQDAPNALEDATAIVDGKSKAQLFLSTELNKHGFDTYLGVPSYQLAELLLQVAYMAHWARNGQE